MNWVIIIIIIIINVIIIIIIIIIIFCYYLPQYIQYQTCSIIVIKTSIIRDRKIYI